MTFIQTTKNWFTNNFTGNDLSLIARGAYKALTDSDARATLRKQGESLWSLGHEDFVSEKFYNEDGELDWQAYSGYLDENSSIALTHKKTKALTLEKEMEISSPFDAFDSGKLIDTESYKARLLIPLVERIIGLGDSVVTTEDLTDLIDKRERPYFSDLIEQVSQEPHFTRESVASINEALDAVNNPMDDEEVEMAQYLVQRAQLSPFVPEKVDCLKAFLKLVEDSNRPSFYDTSVTGGILAPLVLEYAQEACPEEIQFSDKSELEGIERAVWRATGDVKRIFGGVLDRKTAKKDVVDHLYQTFLGNIGSYMSSDPEASIEEVEDLIGAYEGIFERATAINSEFQAPTESDDEGNIVSNTTRDTYLGAIDVYLAEFARSVEELPADGVDRDYMETFNSAMERVGYFTEMSGVSEDEVQAIGKRKSELTDKVRAKIKPPGNEEIKTYITDKLLTGEELSSSYPDTKITELHPLGVNFGGYNLDLKLKK